MFTLRTLLLATLFTAGLAAAPTAQAAEVLVVIDSSGSMAARTDDGLVKLEAARTAVQNLQPQLRKHAVGLLLFGHRLASSDAGSCSDIELVAPIAADADAAFTAGLARLSARGRTPLASTLDEARMILLGMKRDTQKIIVVVTDGNETCGGDPVAAAKALRDAGIQVELHVVGFALGKGEDAQLRSMALAGGGSYIDAKNAASLSKALPAVVRSAVMHTEARTTASEVLIDDSFDGDAFSESWEIIRPDLDRIAAADGTAYIVTQFQDEMSKVKNLLVAKTPLTASDVDVETAMNVQIRHHGHVAGVMLYQDDKNYVTLHAAGLPHGNNTKRAVVLSRVIDGEHTSQYFDLGNGPDQASTRYVLRMEKRGMRIVGRLQQTDENTGKTSWVEVGRTAVPTLVQPRVGLLAYNRTERYHGVGKVAEIDAAYEYVKAVALTIERTRVAPNTEGAIAHTTFDSPSAFERDFEILNEDRTRVGAERGLHIVSQPGWYGDVDKPVRNIVLSRKDVPEGDFRIDVQASGRLTSQGGHFGVMLYQDDDNWVELAHDTRGAGGYAHNPNLRLVRSTRGTVSPMHKGVARDGSDESETFVLRLERKGVRVTASANVWDPTAKKRIWIEIGTQTMLRFKGRIGLFAYTPPNTLYGQSAHAFPIRFDSLTVYAK